MSLSFLSTAAVQRNLTASDSKDRGGETRCRCSEDRAEVDGVVAPDCMRGESEDIIALEHARVDVDVSVCKRM